MQGIAINNKNPCLMGISLIVMVVLAMGACTSSSSPSPGTGGTTEVNSDSVVTAKIEAIREQTSGYPWELSVLIENSTDVNNLPNPTKDSIGKLITVKTDQDIGSFKVGDVVNAKVKYVGDVPKPGIILYMYNIALEIYP